MLGALVERALDARAHARVTAHLDGCASCRQVVIAAVRAGVAAAAPPLATGTPTLGTRGGAPLSPAPTADAGLDTTASPAGAIGAAGAAPRRGRAGRAAGPAIGDRVGRYELRRLLGAGGMGRVYEAFDPELDRAIALKVMRPELSGATALLTERLVRESRLMAKVTHPSVVAVYDVGRTGDDVFIAMELIRGETLGAHVRRAQPPWRRTVELLVRAGQGLAAAHARGVIHRDFKPDNILVELDGDRVARVAVTDFGVARAFADELPAPGAAAGALPPATGSGAGEPGLTATGVAVGTPAYMGPEQLDGLPVDHRADVFAFAVTAWELLLGARPFAGRTAAELRAALDVPPVPPRGRGVPSRIVRALARGLAPEPAARWPDMAALLRELSAGARARRRRVAAAAVAGVALVGLGLGLGGGHVLAGAPEDPCRAAGEALDAAYGAARGIAVRGLLAGHPEAGRIAAKLDGFAGAWREVHAATCRAAAEPIQPVKTAACLDARRLELAGYVEDLLAAGAPATPHAARLAGTLGDPAACRDPAPGLIAARVPADPDLRRRVNALRAEVFEIEAARDRGDHARAIERGQRLARDAAAVWPPVHAEALYVLATAQLYGGDNAVAMAALREAAALAERVHHDHITANVWLQLAMGTAFDGGDPRRGLEYLAYAEAAIDRLGQPAVESAILAYTRGAVLVEADRRAEAEPYMRRALELAERDAPELLAEAIQGLGMIYEEQGKYHEAIAAYRRALDKLAERGAGLPAAEVIIRGRLATALGVAGQATEAVAVMREAVRIAEATMAETNLDRAVARINLAQVQAHAGQLEEALAEARTATAMIGRLLGERSERYGEAMSLVASLLSDLERYDEAARQFARACDVIAFGIGEGTSRQAECWLGEVGALEGLGRDRDALALAERALEVLRRAYGDRHPQVAAANVQRGYLRVQLGLPGAREELELAHGVFEEHALDPGHLAAAKYALGLAVVKADRRRARALIEQAAALFAKAGGRWAVPRRDAAAWLAANPAR